MWPATANREGCHEAKKELKDGFSCPADKQKNDANGQIVAHPHFTHPEGEQSTFFHLGFFFINFIFRLDCQKFYVCLNGIEPRELGCPSGEVFNDDIKKCDAPENVPGW